MRNVLRELPKAFTLILAMIALPGSSAAARIAEIAKFDPISAYGGRIAFDVLRNVTPVGFHTVNFEKDGREVLVSSHMKLSLEMLFITLYRLDYISVSCWRDGQITGVNVSVDDNGTPFSLSAVVPTDGVGLRVQAGADTFFASQPVYPTDHWNPGVLNQIRVLNTLTGRINQVGIEQLGRQTVPTERGSVEATHYAYNGVLKTEVWYDDFGRWVKIRFMGTDGSTIEYRCRRCQDAP